MLLPFLLSLVFFAPAVTAAEAPVGTITGNIAVPEKMKITKPVQVVVFYGEYANLYAADVQQRLDNYWEDYKAAFIQDKQAFILFRELAERQAMQNTLNRMKSENPLIASNFIRTTTNNAFEFRNVPLGECRVVALVTVGVQEYVWSDSVILRNDNRSIVTLKPTVP